MDSKAVSGDIVVYKACLQNEMYLTWHGCILDSMESLFITFNWTEHAENYVFESMERPQKIENDGA